MKKFKIALKHFRGSFLPIQKSRDKTIIDIVESLEKIEYYGCEFDKLNMREDVHSVNRDFNKSLKKSKAKFELTV